MTWADVLALGPTVIARTLGCSVTTASSWIHRSGPPEWEQRWFLLAFEQPPAPAKRQKKS